jgi:hypothetical protein
LEKTLQNIFKFAKEKLNNSIDYTLQAIVLEYLNKYENKNAEYISE